MSLFEQILSTNLINFLIVIGTLALIIKKARLGELLDKMATDVKEKIEKSSTDAASALSEYKATKKAVKDTPKLQEEILSNAQISAQSLKEKIGKATKKQQDEIRYGVEKVLLNQNERAKKATIAEIYNACVELAKEEILKRLDKETHKKLINASIKEIEKIEGSLS